MPSGIAMMKRRRKILFLTGAATLSGLIALILLELLLWMANPFGVRQAASWHFYLYEVLQPSANPERVWENAPGYNRTLPSGRVAINQAGFRGGQAAAAPKPPGVWRVAVLGDSMAFGMNIDDEDTAAAQLEGLLNERFSGQRFQVINAGVIGYTTLQQEATLIEQEREWQADAVIVWWYPNDTDLTGSADSAPQSEQLRRVKLHRPHSLSRQFIHNCYEVLPCTAALARLLYVLIFAGEEARQNFDPSLSPEGLRANLDALRRMAALLDEHGTPLIVYSFAPFEEIEEFCSEINVPFAVTSSTPREVIVPRYAISRSDFHFNREGNRAVALTWLRALMEHAAMGEAHEEGAPQ